MTRQVFKYPLKMDPAVQLVEMPIGAKFRAFQMQGSTPTLWAEIDDAVKSQIVPFLLFGTGWEIPADAHYIGTAQQSGFVWHLYTRGDFAP
jgi:hypothetical protein